MVLVGMATRRHRARPAVARAVRAGRPLPRRRAGPADAQGVRPGQGAGRDASAGSATTLPAGDRRGTLRLAFLSARWCWSCWPPFGRAGRGRGRAAAARRQPRPAHRAVVLILAPEAYLPLRAGRRGVPRRAPRASAAADAVFDVARRRRLADDRHRPGSRRAGARGSSCTASPSTYPDGGRARALRRPRPRPRARRDRGRDRPERRAASPPCSPCSPASCVPDAGRRCSVGGGDLAEVDPTAWRRSVAWVPQRPSCSPGTSPTTSGSAARRRPTSEVARAGAAVGPGRRSSRARRPG